MSDERIHELFDAALSYIFDTCVENGDEDGVNTYLRILQEDLGMTDEEVKKYSGILE